MLDPLTCITAATPSAEVHLVAQGVPAVLLDAFKQVSQLRCGLDLGYELVQLWVLVCARNVQERGNSAHGRALQLVLLLVLLLD